MPSFDVVSETDAQEVDNAVNQTAKEMSTRFDFRGGKSSIEFDRTAKTVKILADDDLKLKAIQQMLEQRLAKRQVDLKCLDYGKEEAASGDTLRQIIKLKNGIDKEAAKKVTKVIKDSGLKVQSQIQDEQVRVTAKKIDDLQALIAILKKENVGIPLQFVNMRS